MTVAQRSLQAEQFRSFIDLATHFRPPGDAFLPVWRRIFARPRPAFFRGTNETSRDGRTVLARAEIRPFKSTGKTNGSIYETTRPTQGSPKGTVGSTRLTATPRESHNAHSDLYVPCVFARARCVAKLLTQRHQAKTGEVYQGASGIYQACETSRGQCPNSAVLGSIYDSHEMLKWICVETNPEIRPRRDNGSKVDF